VTFTASVAAGATGTVTFMDGTTVLGTGTITGYSATLTTATLTAGTHSITAAYSGDTNFNGVSSAALSLVVNQAIPGVGPIPPVSVASSLSPSPAGEPVTLTVTVPPGATGTVNFYDGTKLIGTATIIGNTATLIISTLPAGTHAITAVYSGDANFASVTSAVFSQEILSTADFSVALSTGSQLIPPGASAGYTIVVSSVNGTFTNPVTMSATNLPSGATFTFTPATVTPGAAGASTAFTVSVPRQSNVVASRSRRLGPAAFALLLLPFACVKRYRRRPQRLLLWMLMGFASLGAVSGCGEGGYFSQPQQTYTITVTGTSGDLVRSTTVTLTVQ
jgi:hypothetical protein